MTPGSFSGRAYLVSGEEGRLATELPNREWLTPEEVAAFFHVSRSTAYAWCEAAVMASARVGGARRIRRSSIEQVLARQALPIP
jgi:excisionase family DNA binding protein